MDKGNIYKIVSDSTDKIYIGSTVKSLEERLEEHENDYELWFNKEFKSGYISSFEILKYEDAYIELLEEYPCENKQQLFKREGEMITTLERAIKNEEHYDISDYLSSAR
jgi:hypothetical protein